MLGTACGILAVAAVVTALHPVPDPVLTSGGAPSTGAGAVHALADAWSPMDESPPAGGPLAIPEIGVVLEDYDERHAALTAARLAQQVPPEAGPAPGRHQPAVPEPADSPDDAVAAPPVDPVESLQTPPAPPPVDEPPLDEPQPAPPAPPTPTTPPALTPTAPSTSIPPSAPPSTAPSDTTPPAPTTPPSSPATPPTTTPSTATAPPTTPSTTTPPAPTLPSSPATPPTTTPPPSEEPPTTTPPAPTLPSSPATPPTPEEPPPAGDATLALGQRHEHRNADGDVDLTITLVAVVTAPTCTGADSPPAENGHLIGLQVEVVDAAPPAAGEQPPISAADFRFLDVDGVLTADVDTDSSATCLDAAWPPGQPGPEAAVSGTVVLDVPATTGTIVYRPATWSAGLRWDLEAAE